MSMTLAGLWQDSGIHLTLAGLEVAIFGSEDQRLIHWATRPLNGDRTVALIDSTPQIRIDC